MPEITRNPLCWPNHIGRTVPGARRFKCGRTETFLRGSRQYRFRITALTDAGQPKTLEAVE